ncbi:FAD-dependent oxidoreductase [Georgenia sp. Z1344]|uniref:FAD-dependent oxidoreductase n=1 Tax=Georgenia sp. Z1344 TaxID=3416706 RepID=UPI003CE7C18D
MQAPGSPSDDDATPETAVDVLVVGGGVAGLRTAAALREGGFDGSMLLVGAEDRAPYDRTTLSTHLLTQDAPPALADAGLGDLAALDVDHRLARVTSVSDLGEEAAITLDDGAVMRARTVVAASGARAVDPPWPGARVLRSAADAAALREALAPGARLVVVGAGWIGAEVAGSAAAAGVDVTVVEAGAQPLGRAPGVLGAHVRAWFDAAGVGLVTGAAVRDVTGSADDGAARSHPSVRPAGRTVRLADGRELQADTVLAALGAAPETGWLSGVAELTGSGHVLVDATGRAIGGPAWLRAVGDVAATALPDGSVEPGAHWKGALHHPAAVAAGLLGLEPPPRPASYVFSEMFGHDVAVLGAPAGEPAVVRSDDAGTTWLWTDAAGRLTGAATADHPRDVPPLRRSLAGDARPMLDLEVAADPARRLRDAIARP